MNEDPLDIEKVLFEFIKDHTIEVEIWDMARPNLIGNEFKASYYDRFSGILLLSDATKADKDNLL